MNKLFRGIFRGVVLIFLFSNVLFGGVAVDGTVNWGALNYLDMQIDMSNRPNCRYRFLSDSNKVLSVNVPVRSSSGYGWSYDGVGGTGQVGDKIASLVKSSISSDFDANLEPAESMRIKALVDYLSGNRAGFVFHESYAADRLQSLRSKLILYIEFQVEFDEGVGENLKVWRIEIENAPVLLLYQIGGAIGVKEVNYDYDKDVITQNGFYKIKHGSPWWILLSKSLRDHLDVATTDSGWGKIKRGFESSHLPAVTSIDRDKYLWELGQTLLFLKKQ